MKLTVKLQELAVVVAAGGHLHLVGQRQEAGPFALRAQPRRPGGHDLLERPPYLERQQVLLDVDLGDHRAAFRQDHDEVLLLQLLERLPDWRPSDAQRRAQAGLGDELARLQLEGDDHFLKTTVSLICEGAWLGHHEDVDAGLS